MPTHRIIVEVDLETLEPDDFQTLNRVIRDLSRLASEQAISMKTSTVRSDVGKVINPGLMPATQTVLDYLRKQPEIVTTQNVAPALQISELAARSHLAILNQKGLVDRT